MHILCSCFEGTPFKRFCYCRNGDKRRTDQRFRFQGLAFPLADHGLCQFNSFSRFDIHFPVAVNLKCSHKMLDLCYSVCVVIRCRPQTISSYSVPMYRPIIVPSEFTKNRVGIRFKFKVSTSESEEKEFGSTTFQN